MLNRVGGLTIAAALVVWSSAALAQAGYSGASSSEGNCGPGSAAGSCATPSAEGQAAALANDEDSNVRQQSIGQWQWDRGHYPTYFSPGM